MARPKGQRGTIQKLGKTWRFGYWEPQANGTRKRIWRGGFPDEKSAGRALRKVLVQLDEGTYVPVSDETVGAYLAEWFESQHAHVEANTWVTYRNHVRYYLAPSEELCAAYRERTKTADRPAGLAKPSLAAVRLQALTQDRASRHLAELLERGKRDGEPLRPRTVKGVRITLNAALKSAQESGRLPRPVRVRPVAVPRRRPTVYTPAQTGAFLQVALQDRLAAMWALFVTSAMRPSEVLGLTWEAVDLEAGAISIYMKLIMVDGRAVLAEGTKTPDSEAPLILAPEVLELLRIWQKEQAEERRLWPGPVEDHDLVFTWENGAPLKPRWVARRFKRLAEQAGLPTTTRLYDLRHGWATAALRAGIHPKLVQEVMRHSDYRTTADTYTHVMPSQSAHAVNSVAALFHSGPADKKGTAGGGEKPGPSQESRSPTYKHPTPR
jgi:integrase